MEWYDWMLFFDTEDQKLAAQFPEWTLLVPGDDLPEAFAQAEGEAENEVEAAIAQFADSRLWPQLTPVAGAMLRERIRWAADFAEDIANARPLGIEPPVPPQTAQSIRLLLVEGWTHIGYGRTRGNLEFLPRVGNPQTNASSEPGLN